jgi:hypothetical protein
MPCTICNNPKRQEIDQALVAGSATLTALGQQYGLSTSALHRHKAHLQAKVSRAKDRLLDNLRQGCLFWLSQAVEMTMQTAQAAQAEGNGKVVLQAVSQGTRLITIILKQDLPLDDRLVYDILASPQWTSQPSLLPHNPEILSRSRQALSETLSTPCPEGTAPPSFPDSPVNLDLDALQTLFPTLVQHPARKPQTDNRKLKTKNHFCKREKSGKLPGNSECFIDEVEEYRLVELEKKIAQLDLEALTRDLPPRAANEKLEVIFEELYNSIPIPKDKPLSEYLHEQSLKAHQDKNNGQGPAVTRS